MYQSDYADIIFNEPDVFTNGVCLIKGRHAERIFIEDVLKKYIFPDPQERFSATKIVGASTLFPYPLGPAFISGGVITLLMNYSPCADCARLLHDLAKNHSNFKINIHFVKLFKCHYGADMDKNIEGLQLLHSCSNVNLDVMTSQEYNNLFGPYIDANHANTKQELELKLSIQVASNNLANQLSAISIK